MVLAMVLAVVVNAPSGPPLEMTRENPNGLDLCRAPGEPSFDSLLRLKWTADQNPSVHLLEKQRNPEFASWYATEKGSGPGFMPYFVACAYGDGVVVEYDGAPDVKWHGRFGFAANSMKEERGLNLDERRWVSACLLAHANVKGTVQYLSIRGVTPGGAEPLAPSQSEAWVMGFGEGVFAADLFTPNSSDFGRYTYSLETGQKGCGEDRKTQACVPLLEVLGRTLATGMGTGVECAHNGRGLGALATYVGAFDDHRGDFTEVPPQPGSAPVDPEFGAESVRPEGAKGLYRPLFVKMPHLIDAEAVERKADPKALMSVRSTGAPIKKGQVVVCENDFDCIGGKPWWPFMDPNGEALVGLREGQALEVTIRKDEPKLGVPSEPFTAIIRFRGVPGDQAKLAFRSSAWAEVTPDWDSTVAGKPEYTWMHAYPVYARRDGKYWVLSIQVVGVGDGSKSPRLDAFGFVTQKPWCCDERAPEPRPSWCTVPSSPSVGVCPRPAPYAQDANATAASPR